MQRTHPQILVKNNQNKHSVCSVWDKGYRYGYQGSEKDNNISGNANLYTTLYRELDVRLGRWFSVDPEAQQLPNFSHYNSMNCNPILYNDIDGDIVPLGIFLLVIAMSPDILVAPTGKPGELRKVKILIEQRDNAMLTKMIPPLKIPQLRPPGQYNSPNVTPNKLSESNKSKAETPKPKVDLNKPKVENPKPEVKSQPGAPQKPTSPKLSNTGGLKKFAKNVSPDESLQKQLEGKGQLRNLRNNPNLKGVDIEGLLKKTPRQIEDMYKGSESGNKIIKQINKAFEGRDLGKGN